MTSLSVVTPSYRPDLELCRDLNLSVRRFGPSGVAHHVIVPAADRKAFAGIGDVHAVDGYLPRSFVHIPGNLWVNLRSPILPVRGWIAQQLIKLEFVARSQDSVVLLVDSDVTFIRPFSADTFHRHGEVRFFRAVDAIHAGLPRHICWHRVARELLGVRSCDRMPLNDYICWPTAWDPSVVRSMLRRVEEVTGKPWQTAVASQRHFSEGILYGVYVDEILGGMPYSENTMLCVNYYDETPFEEIEKFASYITPNDIAVMISAKSGTSLASRRRALAAIAASVGADIHQQGAT
ncbi:hypothetical protein GOL31_26665 [Sinorhizobium medicae]|nr:hypothetical protein [Sinorhizobium medicae]